MAKPPAPPPGASAEMKVSPEMKKKMEECIKLQSLLNTKLAEFEHAGAQSKATSLQELEVVEKELLELKKVAANATSDNDPKFQEKVNSINVKLEKMAKSSIQDQMKEIKRHLELMVEAKGIINKILALINTFEIPDEQKQAMKVQFNKLLEILEAKEKEGKTFSHQLQEMSKKVESADKMKIAVSRDLINSKVDEIMKKLEATKSSLQETPTEQSGSSPQK